jgi:hypothetical protein
MRYVLWGQGVRRESGEEVRRFGAIVDNSASGGMTKAQAPMTKMLRFVCAI